MLKGLYSITDNTLTPNETIINDVKNVILGGAKIIQLRDKTNNDDKVVELANAIQYICRKEGILFVLNDKVELAIENNYDGLHVGRSDYHRIEEIRKDFKGILGVSCYDDISKAKEMESLGAEYVAFGSFFSSATKPDSKVVPLEVLDDARVKIKIPVCAIGGITSKNLDEVLKYNVNMVAVISDIWKSPDVVKQAKLYSKRF